MRRKAAPYLRDVGVWVGGGEDGQQVVREDFLRVWCYFTEGMPIEYLLWNTSASKTKAFMEFIFSREDRQLT